MSAIIILPNGDRLDITGGKYSILNGNVVIKTPLETSTVICADSSIAANLIAAIDTFIGTSSPISANPVYSSSPTWSSVSPNTIGLNVGDSITFDLVGTKFLTSAINAIKLDDGLGDALTFDTLFIDTDAQLQVQYKVGTLFPTVAATYTLYFSIDNGLNWTTTGLTIVAS